jgi:hypothetical protein
MVAEEWISKKILLKGTHEKSGVPFKFRTQKINVLSKQCNLKVCQYCPGKSNII